MIAKTGFQKDSVNACLFKSQRNDEQSFIYIKQHQDCKQKRWQRVMDPVLDHEKRSKYERRSMKKVQDRNERSDWIEFHDRF